MYQTLLADAKFHEQLLAFDRDLAARRRATGCPDCGGALHSANYRRKPLGRATALGEDHDRRFRFCCSVDGRRDRSTPPSPRFLGRKVFLAVIVTLMGAMRNGATERRLSKLAATIGVDRRTLARWRGWWQASFGVRCDGADRAGSAAFVSSWNLASRPGSGDPSVSQGGLDFPPRASGVTRARPSSSN